MKQNKYTLTDSLDEVCEKAQRRKDERLAEAVKRKKKILQADNEILK